MDDKYKFGGTDYPPLPGVCSPPCGKDAPEDMPKDLIDEYTLNGKIELKYNYVNEACPKTQEGINGEFTDKNFDASIKRVEKKEEFYYGPTDSWLYEALSKYSILDKDVCVVGSAYPWYEVVALYYGASMVTVIEYSDRPDLDDMVKYIKPDEVGSRKFDSCFSISSIEHDGLGRYGDPLNPNGDLESMNKMKTLISDGGLMYLSIPLGADTVVWNSMRFYGRTRLPMLLDGWEVVDTFGVDERALDMVMPHTYTSYQPVFVLRNT